MYDEDNVTGYLQEPIRTGNTLPYAEWNYLLGMDDLQEPLIDLPSSDDEPEERPYPDRERDQLHSMGFAERERTDDTYRYRRTPAGDQFVIVHERVHRSDDVDEYELGKEFAEYA